jgi:hypothetical protein
MPLRPSLRYFMSGSRDRRRRSAEFGVVPDAMQHEVMHR